MKLNNVIKKSSYLKSITTLVTGTLIAQLIAVASSPVITRIYTPEELGLYTLILSVITMFGSAITGRYDMSLVSAKEEEEVYPLFIACLLISIIFSTIVSLGFVFYISHKTEVITHTGWFIFMVYPMLIFTGIINTLTSYNNRYKEYKVLSTVSVFRSVSQSSGQIILGYLGFGVKGLITSNLIATLVGVKAQFRRLKENLNFFRQVKIKNIKLVLKKYNNQLYFSTPAVLVNTVSYSLINFLVADLYGSAVLGFYSLSYRILGLPLSLISMNVARVFFERASKEFNETGKCKETFKQTFKLLLFLAVPMAIILILLGPTAFGVVFGNQWREAGVYVQILAPMFAIRFIILSLTSVLVITSNQKVELRIQLLFIISTVVTYLLCSFLSFNIYYFLTIISCLYVLCYLFFGTVIYKFSHKK